MAKSKNATTHHNTQKHHRNGIRRLPKNRYQSLKGCNQRFIRNGRAAIKNDPTIKKNKSIQRRINTKKANAKK
ncbi:hypothetical protein pb186bvf_018613 [Paramecium bursaria]